MVGVNQKHMAIAALGASMISIIAGVGTAEGLEQNNIDIGVDSGMVGAMASIIVFILLMYAAYKLLQKCSSDSNERGVDGESLLNVAGRTQIKENTDRLGDGYTLTPSS